MQSCFLVSEVMRSRFWLLVLFAVLLSLSGCKSFQKLLSTDLETTSDEDWVIGKLYEDEYVRESPYLPASSAGATALAGSSSAAQALADIRTARDDKALFDVLMPWMGVPYQYGGTTRKGVDCSAFVGAVYKERYKVVLHRTANDMLQDVTFVDRNQLKQGRPAGAVYVVPDFVGDDVRGALFVLLVSGEAEESRD